MAKFQNNRKTKVALASDLQKMSSAGAELVGELMSRTKRVKIKTGAPLRDGQRQRPVGSCNNHGGCPKCEGNRLHKYNRHESLEEATKALSGAAGGE
jgi:hypothetical protein